MNPKVVFATLVAALLAGAGVTAVVLFYKKHDH